MNILVYSKPDCPYCVKAKQLLEGIGWSYKELVVGKDFTAEWFKSNLWSSYPCVVVNDIVIGGYDNISEYVADWLI